MTTVHNSRRRDNDVSTQNKNKNPKLQIADNQDEIDNEIQECEEELAFLKQMLNNSAQNTENTTQVTQSGNKSAEDIAQTIQLQKMLEQLLASLQQKKTDMKNLINAGDQYILDLAHLNQQYGIGDDGKYPFDLSTSEGSLKYQEYMQQQRLQSDNSTQLLMLSRQVENNSNANIEQINKLQEHVLQNIKNSDNVSHLQSVADLYNDVKEKYNNLTLTNSTQATNVANTVVSSLSPYGAINNTNPQQFMNQFFGPNTQINDLSSLLNSNVAINYILLYVGLIMMDGSERKLKATSAAISKNQDATNYITDLNGAFIDFSKITVPVNFDNITNKDINVEINPQGFDPHNPPQYPKDTFVITVDGSGNKILYLVHANDPTQSKIIVEVAHPEQIWADGSKERQDYNNMVDQLIAKPEDKNTIGKFISTYGAVSSTLFSGGYEMTQKTTTTINNLFDLYKYTQDLTNPQTDTTRNAQKLLGVLQAENPDITNYLKSDTTENRDKFLDTFKRVMSKANSFVSGISSGLKPVADLDTFFDISSHDFVLDQVGLSKFNTAASNLSSAASAGGQVSNTLNMFIQQDSSDYERTVNLAMMGPNTTKEINRMFMS